MLHAFSHKKSRLYRRYLGRRDDPLEGRVAEEDEITSLIMGPLAFLSPAAIGAFWSALIQLRHPCNDLPLGAPTHAAMHFWPRRGAIEPDMRVDLSWGDISRTLLVEFKWRAGLSGEYQLHDQWEKYLYPEEKDHAYHLFIGPDTTAGIAAMSLRDPWEGRLLLRSWFDVLTCASSIRGESELELKRWIEQVVECFKLLNIRPFQGFDKLQAPAAIDKLGSIFFHSVQSCSKYSKD